MKRFRVKTVYMYGPSEHRYFNTFQGAEAHIIRRLFTSEKRVFSVAVYDNEQRDTWGQLIHQGHVGNIGGMVPVRSHLTRIARRFQSWALGALFGLDPREWSDLYPENQSRLNRRGDEK